MTCPDCTAARARTWHAGYSANCLGCEMRGFARSRHVSDLVAAIRQARPDVPLPTALAAVLDWWRHDHPQPETA